MAISKFDEKIAAIKEDRIRFKNEINAINDILKKVDDELKPILKQRKQLDDLIKSKADSKQPHLTKLRDLQDQLEILEEAEHKLASRRNLASQLLERGYDVEVIYEASDKELSRLQSEMDELAGSESKLKAQEERLHGIISNLKKDPGQRKEIDFSKKIRNLRKAIVTNSQQVEATGNNRKPVTTNNQQANTVNNKKVVLTNSQQVEAVSNDNDSEDRVTVSAEDKKAKRLNIRNWKSN